MKSMTYGFDYQECLDKIEKEKLNSFYVPFGKDDNHELICFDVSELKNILIAGNKGSGKSNFKKAFVATLLKRNKKEDMQFVFLNDDNEKPSLIPNDNLFLPLPKSKDDYLSYLNSLKEEIIKRQDLAKNDKDSFEKLPLILISINELDNKLVQNKEFMEALYFVMKNGKDVGVFTTLITSEDADFSLLKNHIDLCDSKISFKTDEHGSNLILGSPHGRNLLFSGEAYALLKGMKEPLHFYVPFLEKKNN